MPSSGKYLHQDPVEKNIVPSIILPNYHFQPFHFIFSSRGKISVDPPIGEGGSARGFLNRVSYVKGVTHLAPTVSQLAVHYLHRIKSRDGMVHVTNPNILYS